MKTKEFIKMLQDADPSGEAYIRMDGGVPIYAEIKEGYWDGTYQYIDEDGNFITTSRGMKVDLHCKNLDDFIDDLINIHDPDNWEKIKSKIKFDFNNYVIQSQRQERIDQNLNQAKKYYDELYEMHLRVYNNGLNEMIENSKKGWTWFQNKDVEKNETPNMHVYYTWKIYNENGKDVGSNIHQTQSILRSGQWEKLDNNVKNGYYQWIFKNKK